MTFRRFKQSDISGICRLINCELGYNVAENDLAIRINQMQKDKNYCIFVAENDNKVIAFIGLHIGIAFEFSGKVMRIIALAVKRDYQRQGICKKLLQTAENYGAENQTAIISVNSGLQRTSAHRFYEKQGFYKKGYSFARILTNK